MSFPGPFWIRPNPKLTNSNEWNRIRVRLEENGRMICSVNNEVVIDMIDHGLKSGKVGLCKFREPTARFVFFRVSKRFPKSEITPILPAKYGNWFDL